MQKSLFTLRIPTEKQTKSDYVSLATLACIKASSVCACVSLKIQLCGKLRHHLKACFRLFILHLYTRIFTWCNSAERFRYYTYTVRGLFKTYLKRSSLFLIKYKFPLTFILLYRDGGHMITGFLCILREMFPVKMSFSSVCYGLVKWESTPW